MKMLGQRHKIVKFLFEKLPHGRNIEDKYVGFSIYIYIDFTRWLLEFNWKPYHRAFQIGPMHVKFSHTLKTFKIKGN